MFKPLQLSDAIAYISARDPSIDWPRIEDLEIQAAANRPVDDETNGMDGVGALTERERARLDFEIRLAGECGVNPAATIDRYLIKEGERATVFSVGVIPPGEMNRIVTECNAIDGKPNRSEMYWRSFLAGLRGIENWEVGDGKVPTRAIDGVEYVDPSWSRKTFIRGLRLVAIEVGRTIWLWNQFTGEDAKK